MAFGGFTKLLNYDFSYPFRYKLFLDIVGPNENLRLGRRRKRNKNSELISGKFFLGEPETYEGSQGRTATAASLTRRQLAYLVRLCQPKLLAVL